MGLIAVMFLPELESLPFKIIKKGFLNNLLVKSPRKFEF